MKLRITQIFNQAVDTIILPKRNESYRLVSIHCRIDTPTLVAAQLMVAIVDGAQNVIERMQSVTRGGGAPTTSSNITFGVGLNNDTAAQDFATFAMPDEMWIQPQWEVQIFANPNGALCTLANCNVQTEVFLAPGKKVAPREVVPQDTDSG